MQLSRFTDLGLRALMRIATAPAGKRITTKYVAEQMNASETHMAKVISRLNRMGVLNAMRGRDGGLAITDAGMNRSVGSLVRDLEGLGSIVDCSACPLDGACRLRHLLGEAEHAFLERLDTVPLKDLVSPPTKSVLLTLAMRPPADEAMARQN